MKIITMNMDVKKILTTAFITLVWLGLNAQTGVKNTFTIEAGAGGNAYRLETNHDFGSAIAASWDLNLTAGYYFHDRVNLNFEYEYHTYITGNSDSAEFQSDYLGANRIGIGLRYAVIDRPHYQLSVGGSAGVFNFAYDISDSVTTASFKAHGIYQTYGLTNKFVFGSTGAFGLFLKVGIVNNPMSLKEILINGEQQESFNDISVDDYKFNSLGYYLKFGFTYSLLGNRKKGKELK